MLKWSFTSGSAQLQGKQLWLWEFAPGGQDHSLKNVKKRRLKTIQLKTSAMGDEGKGALNKV